MGECGCFGSGGTFRLPAPGGWYRLLLSPPCKDCDMGGTITVEFAPNDSDCYEPEYDEPLNIEAGVSIACSLSASDLKKAFEQALDGKLDEWDAEFIAEEVEEELPRYPHLLVFGSGNEAGGGHHDSPSQPEGLGRVQPGPSPAPDAIQFASGSVCHSAESAPTDRSDRDQGFCDGICEGCGQPDERCACDKEPTHD